MSLKACQITVFMAKRYAYTNIFVQQLLSLVCPVDLDRDLWRCGLENKSPGFACGHDLTGRIVETPGFTLEQDDSKRK
jgi:hypothetical protein